MNPAKESKEPNCKQSKFWRANEVLFHKARRWPVFGVLLVTSFLNSASAQFSVDFAPEYYVWQEYMNGSKALEETGARYALSAQYVQPRDQGFLFGVMGKVYAGSVDYENFTAPITGSVDYYGGIVEGQLLYRWSLGERYQGDLGLRLGADLWIRDLGSISAVGFEEDWLVSYSKLGYQVSPKDTGWIGALGIKLPIYTLERAKLSQIGMSDVDIEPGRMVSPYAEVGYKFTRSFSAIAFMDSYWFSESPHVSNTYGIFWQPESIMFSAGLKVRWTF